jgi:hypothetical protein
VDSSSDEAERVLRVVGEVDVFWRWREESGFPENQYRQIDDALDTGDAYLEQYCLLLKGNGERHPRNAWLKLDRNNFKTGAVYELDFPVKAEALSIIQGGGLGLELGIYLSKAGRHPDDIFDLPDLKYELFVSEGTYDWNCMHAKFRMPDNAVMILIRVGGMGFYGTVKFGTPLLRSEGGETLVPPFGPSSSVRLSYNWLGENLSRKEWPEFLIRIDGRKLFHGAVFNAIFRWPDFELPMPELERGEHEVELTLLAEYLSAPPFVIRQVELIECNARSFEIVGHSMNVSRGTVLPVLIKTKKDDLILRWNDGDEDKAQHLCKAGRHVIEIDAKAFEFRQEVVLTDGTMVESVKIELLLEKCGNGLLLSSGDAVYIPHTKEALLSYLDWYIFNGIGNAICFRPVYRWSGSRLLDESAWKELVPLLERLKMGYFLMVDGRELAGMDANPPDALLEGEYYLGRQAHEQDGAFCYWGNDSMSASCRGDSLFIDLFARSHDNGGIFPSVRPIRRGGQLFRYYDPSSAADMREAAGIFVENLKKGKGTSTRHTGPSTLFRYFYQAGYEIVGAEMMYGPEEVLVSALRGAARAYGKDMYSAHLAMQWNSSPLDTQEHADRYFLSLAVCYLNGVKQINLEEGLWRIESEYAYYDRFSSCCRKHLDAHRKFRRFIESRERRGRMRVPFAVLQGRWDGWGCFGRGPVWGQRGSEWAFGEPEKSFDLLNVFYPRSLLDSIYRSQCPRQPQGWYSGTPFGPVDLLPIEGEIGRAHV